jgi:hypothetical protein
LKYCFFLQPQTPANFEFKVSWREQGELPVKNMYPIKILPSRSCTSLSTSGLGSEELVASLKTCAALDVNAIAGKESPKHCLSPSEGSRSVCLWTSSTGQWQGSDDLDLAKLALSSIPRWSSPTSPTWRPVDHVTFISSLRAKSAVQPTAHRVIARRQSTGSRDLKRAASTGALSDAAASKRRESKRVINRSASVGTISPSFKAVEMLASLKYADSDGKRRRRLYD